MVRSRARQVVVALATVLAVAGALAGGPAQGAADLDIDLGRVGKAAALSGCASKSFVDGRPGRLEVRYGVKQRTPAGSRNTFVLRNHAGKWRFCDFFGPDRPSVLPMPRPSMSRPAVHATNPKREFRCTGDTLTRFRTNAFLRVQDPVGSARMRYFVDGVAGPWFVTERQRRFVHLQSWLLDVPKSSTLKIQMQVLNRAGNVMSIRGLPSRPRPLNVSCGIIIG
jgi:hypothetical protein